MQHFLKGRLALIREVAELPIAHYADVVLILMAVLSGCASWRWPGKGADRKKFVELLVSHSPVDLHTSWISVPALLNHRHIADHETPYEVEGSTRIFVDDEIDLPIDAAAEKYPTVPRDTLRKHCYATLIYEWLRCGYSHEYWHGEFVTHVPPSGKNAKVSYINRSGEGGSRKMAGFQFEYLLSLAVHHVDALPASAQQIPNEWWIETG